MAQRCLSFAVYLQLLAGTCLVQAQVVNNPAGTNQGIGQSPAAYFPPSESKGGWRKLEDPQEVRRLGGMDPGKLQELKRWLLDSDDRPFAAVVIRHGYIVLEV